jgi:hypothetical protein
VLRADPTFVRAFELVRGDGAYSCARTVRTLFDDASIRFSSLGSGKSGASIVAVFTDAIDAGFAEAPGAHTYVMCFDAKEYVPARKLATQLARRKALARSVGRKRKQAEATTTEAAEAAAATAPPPPPPWHYDGTSTIVDALSYAPAPPWAAVRLDARAYARAVDDIARALLTHYTPPRGRRLIVDTSAFRRVIETSDEGVVCEAYDDVVAKPRIGEADMSAPYYVTRGLVADEVVPESVVRTRRRRLERDARHDVYINTVVVADAAADGSNALRESTPPPLAFRSVYERGDVMTVSTDIDFVVLGLVAHTFARRRTNAPAAAAAAGVHVRIGAAHTDGVSDVYCKSTHASACAVTEYVNVARLEDAVVEWHRVPADDDVRRAQALDSFLVFCIACGNDYVARLYGVSHERMFEAYRELVRGAGRLLVAAGEQVVAADAPRRVVRFDARAFAYLVRGGYHFGIRNEDARPSSWADDELVAEWPALAGAVRATQKDVRRHMPSRAHLVRYYEQVVWATLYAQLAMFGIEYVPEPLAILDGGDDDDDDDAGGIAAL